MDEEFYNNLNADQKSVYDRYKANTSAFCYILNAHLRHSDFLTHQTEIALLDQITSMYQTPEEIILYRATIEANVNNYITGDIYSNPEFLSATTDVESVQQHFTDTDHPVYMIITCPIGMYMAPMQGNVQFGDSENEMLLSRNNNFKIVNNRLTNNRNEIAEIMGRDFAQDVESLRIIEVKALI
ncbi:hypothetical protein NLG42_10505 [Flavobacterium plurextorum]|uniref:ADP-ribosyltransferase n=1 Tax=Flavobacterium TaxID=237 RepID=UPI00214DD808|nr:MULTISPECIES: ADP-ribosyltransferase [Flavobacterium]UUW11218.1 hypothetical protein NLG42_10505 [Flavobacterium plurextorum]